MTRNLVPIEPEAPVSAVSPPARGSRGARILAASARRRLQAVGLPPSAKELLANAHHELVGRWVSQGWAHLTRRGYRLTRQGRTFFGELAREMQDYLCSLPPTFRVNETPRAV